MSHDNRDLGERLRALRIDPPDGDFAASLHRRLAAAGPFEEPSWWRRLWPRVDARVLWPALGVAAGLLAFFAAGQLRHPPDVGTATLFPSTKVAVVRVNLSAEVAVASAQIKVSLPDGLVFWADGEELPQRALEWTQALRKGNNDVPIAVRGLRPGRYRMMVTAQVGGQLVEDEVLLEVTSG